MKLDLTFRHAGALVLASLLAGAAPAALMAQTPADTLVIGDAIDDIVSIDPHEAFEFSGTDLVNNTYDTLIEQDPTRPGELVPGLAESWDVAEDGLTYTFKMRPGVTFASGNPVRAEDAVFSLQRVVKLDKTPAFILKQFGFTAENVEEMITFEGDTVTLKTDKPFAPSFVYNCLTAAVGSIVDKETVMANEVNGDMGNEWLKSNTAGTGAYVLRSFKPSDSYILEAREGHWRGDAKLKRVFMRHIPEGATNRLLLERGDIDVSREVTSVDIEGMEGNADIRVETDLAGYIYYVSANMKNEALANPKVLEAMRWAIDYQGMADSFLKGEQTVHQAFLPRGYLGAIEETPYSLDVEKAKALLEESGVELPLNIKMSVRNAQNRTDMAQSIQNTFAQVGINLTLSIAEGAEVLGEYRARQHDLTLQSWGPDYPDPHTNASTFAINADNADEAQLTGSLAWRNAYEPGELMTMTEAAVIERDTEKRRAMYEDIQRQHRDTSPFIAMFQENNRTAMRANVKNFYTGGTVDSVTYWLVEK